jgi:hypothetical protein
MLYKHIYKYNKQKCYYSEFEPSWLVAYLAWKS